MRESCFQSCEENATTSSHYQTCTVKRCSSCSFHQIYWAQTPCLSMHLERAWRLLVVRHADKKLTGHVGTYIFMFDFILGWNHWNKFGTSGGPRNLRLDTERYNKSQDEQRCWGRGFSCWQSIQPWISMNSCAYLPLTLPHAYITVQPACPLRPPVGNAIRVELCSSMFM